jgi:hypothetical protein
MQVRVACHISQIDSYVDYYESNGFELLNKHHEQEEVTLVFKGSSAAHVAEAASWDNNAQAFLEFSDGTQSPLYVRKQRWLDD